MQAVKSCSTVFEHTLTQGSPTSVPEDHMSHYTTVQGVDVLRNVIVSWYVTFYQINKFFVNILCFSLLINGFAGRSLETLLQHTKRFFYWSECCSYACKDKRM